MEQHPAQPQDDADLNHANKNVRNDLPDHQFNRSHRRRYQHFHVAPLPLADDCGRGKHDHRHGQNDRDQTRHNIDDCALLGVIEQRHFKGGCNSIDRKVQQFGHRHATQTLDGRGNDRIGSIRNPLGDGLAGFFIGRRGRTKAQ